MPEDTPTPITAFISTAEASERYKLPQEYLAYLARKRVIVGQKIARNWLVVPSSIEAYLANRPKPGRKPTHSKGDGNEKSTRAP
jgi:hypothetical protein